MHSVRTTGVWPDILSWYHPKPYRPSRKNMNRRKKINQLLKAHAKKASAKLAPRKPKYISKADRLKLDAESTPESVVSSES